MCRAKGDNSKSIDARVMYPRHIALPYHTLSTDETSLQFHKQNRGYHPDKKKCQRGITPKILMPELWTLCMTLFLINVYPYMKFHSNSIIIVQTRKSDKGE